MGSFSSEVFSLDQLVAAPRRCPDQDESAVADMWDGQEPLPERATVPRPAAAGPHADGAGGGLVALHNAPKIYAGQKR
jgi:hypothetical protein